MEIRGISPAVRGAIARELDLSCDVAVVWWTTIQRVLARAGISAHGDSGGSLPRSAVTVDHGYVFVQETEAACIACLFPSMVNDDDIPVPARRHRRHSPSRRRTRRLRYRYNCSCPGVAPGITAGLGWPKAALMRPHIVGETDAVVLKTRPRWYPSTA